MFIIGFLFCSLLSAQSIFTVITEGGHMDDSGYYLWAFGNEQIVLDNGNKILSVMDISNSRQDDNNIILTVDTGLVVISFGNEDIKYIQYFTNEEVMEEDYSNPWVWKVLMHKQ